MKKSDNGRHVLLVTGLGILIVLVAGAWLFLMVGPVYGNAPSSKEEGEIAMTAVAREEQEPVFEVSLEETVSVVRNDHTESETEVPAEVEGPASVEGEPGTGTEQHAAVTVQEGKDTYILPESNSRYYTKEELAGLDDNQLYLARNEIYARLGRKFKSEELTRYFGAKSWYRPQYEPSAFDNKGDGIFNPYELSNRNLIISIEEERKGR